MNSGYQIESIDFVYIGRLEVGTPVIDQRACQTGFALYFYGNKKFTPTDNAYSPKMYLYCVNLKEVISSNKLKYDIDGTERIYNTRRLNSGDTNDGNTISYDTASL